MIWSELGRGNGGNRLGGLLEQRLGPGTICIPCEGRTVLHVSLPTETLSTWVGLASLMGSAPDARQTAPLAGNLGLLHCLTQGPDRVPAELGQCPE